jgi:uncharacterized protein (DUF2235 family)
MSKNIVLCSDGTGKAGGAILNTNVFRLYKAVDLQNENQIAFYDNGIGSTGFKTLRLISGAFGFGFQKNVMNLYAYLAKRYEPGDKIYMYGFSRGAATIRALAGMIQAVGLIDTKNDSVRTGGRLDQIKLRYQIFKALRLYKRAAKNQKKVEKFKTSKTHGAVDIEVLGVWDTVEALGFPQDSSWILIGISMLIDKVTNIFFPHRFYNFQLDRNVKNVYHALAIDDERRTFAPLMFDETADERPENIEQVWFAGSHSNVGGGLPRTGLSMIALDWMMKKSSNHGLKFNTNLWDDVKEGMNPAGHLKYSRRGMNGYYRFKPRHIRDISTNIKGESILQDNIKVHSSVFDRISLKYYAPIFPNKFDIVSTEEEDYIITYEVGEMDVKKLKHRVNTLYQVRTILYHMITESTLLATIFMWYLNTSNYTFTLTSRTAQSIFSAIPSIFHNFIHFSFIEHTWVGSVLLVWFSALFGARKVSKFFTDRTKKKLMWWLFHDFKDK